jgi:3-isopropylmalate/(R)-2-methylmalate dehydratase small subunit
MKPVTVVAGSAVPLYRADIDTDQIMPKQFLKRVERTGFGEVIFYDWRQDPDFVLNDARYEGANILVTGRNFGTGSSREHAPWGLQQHGFEAIIAPSFGDIFATNCTKIGLLLVVLPAETCAELAERATRDPSSQLRIDLPAQTVGWDDRTAAFDISPERKHVLVEGLDEITATLQHEAAIAAYESRRPAWLPAAPR